MDREKFSALEKKFHQLTQTISEARDKQAHVQSKLIQDYMARVPIKDCEHPIYLRKTEDPSICSYCNKEAS